MLGSKHFLQVEMSPLMSSGIQVNFLNDFQSNRYKDYLNVSSLKCISGCSVPVHNLQENNSFSSQ